jgi:hypothetical protein
MLEGKNLIIPRKDEIIFFFMISSAHVQKQVNAVNQFFWKSISTLILFFLGA